MIDLLSDLNPPQREAVMHVDGPLLVLAGAGSGKTRVITRRVAYLVQQGIAPREILAITFTNKAAGEMRERVDSLGTPWGTTVCTFHSLCARLLREFAPEIGLDPNYTIYDRDDQLKVVKQALAHLHLTGGGLTPGSVHSIISNAKNDLQTADVFAGQASTRRDEQLAELYRHYEKTLRTNNALDFDDLLMRMASLLRDRPDVRQYLGQRFRYVQIDEYQDTNHAQYILAHGIALEHKNVCATGDPDQSIYAWRGADIQNILDFEKDYPAAKVIRLEENYRSTAPILAAADKLIAHNTERKPKKLFTRREGGANVQVVTLDDERAEARTIAERIERYRSRGGEYGNIGVFYRVNSLSRLLEEALLHKGVPYRIARGVEFYNRKEIKDMLAYLKALANPTDDVSCLRIINTPARGIGTTTIKRLQVFAAMQGLSLLQAAERSDEAGLSTGPGKKVKAFAERISAMAADLSRPVQAILEDVFRRSGMEQALSGGDEDAQQAKGNVEELISAASAFAEKNAAENPEATGTLPEFLQQISLVSDADHFEGGPRAVTLMTLHAAKGLEFPAVFMAGCEEDLLPFRRVPQGSGSFGVVSFDDKELEEERRLAFVGITRAMDELTMTCVRSRMIRGQRLPQAASGFLLEIGEENITREDLTTHDSTAGRQAWRGGFRPGGPGGFEKKPFRHQAPDKEREVIEAMSVDDWGSQVDDNENPMPAEYEHLRKGVRVYHPKFGPGTVLKVAQRWPGTKVTIDFDRAGQKVLLLSMANLELTDNGW